MIQAVKSAKEDVCTNRLAAFIDLNEFLYSSINEFWVNFTEKENKKRSLIPSILMDSQKVHTDHYSSIKNMLKTKSEYQKVLRRFFVNKTKIL